MDKPTSKAGLIDSIKAERKNLENSLKGLSSIDMIKIFASGEWTVQDILAHITAWENKLLGWYQAGLRGEKQVMPDWDKPGVIDDINLEIYKRNHDRWIKEVRKEFKASYKRILKTIKNIPEDTLFTPGKVDWTGKDTLADWITANTSRHYAEHIPMIQAIRQKMGM
jgi:hypothetical protein